LATLWKVEAQKNATNTGSLALGKNVQLLLQSARFNHRQ
jgi:hypothetical protein